MRITFILDTAYPIDAEDILGDLQILDDAGRELSITNTYVDSWLDILQESLKKITNNECLELQIPEEPDVIELSRVKDRVSAKSSTQCVSFDRAEGVRALNTTIQQLVRLIESSDSRKINPVLEALKRSLKS